MEWIENTSYHSLIERIDSRRVRSLLHYGETLTNDHINVLRKELSKLQNESNDQSEKWQAYHADYYYECTLQKKKEILHQSMPSNVCNEYSGSDDVNENEEEKELEL